MTKRRFLEVFALAVIVLVGIILGSIVIRTGLLFDRTVTTYVATIVLLGLLITAAAILVPRILGSKRVLPLFLVAILIGPVLGVLLESSGVSQEIGPQLQTATESEDQAPLTVSAQDVQDRCDEIAENDVIAHTTISQDQAFPDGGLDPLAIENGSVLGDGKTIFIEPLSDSTLLVAAVTRLGPYKSELFTLPIDGPSSLEANHLLNDQAIFDLEFDQTSQTLYYSFVDRSDDCLRLGVMRVPASESSIEWNAAELIYETEPCLNPLPRDALRGSGRLALTDNGQLLIAIGGFGTEPSTLQEQIDASYADPPPQDIGAIVELDLDSLQARTFSKGHRNPQGLVVDANSGQIWSSEHGPSGGDEVNLIRDGSDYGWQSVTYGKPYDGLQQLSDPEFAYKYQEATATTLGLDRWCNSGDGQFSAPAALLSGESIAPSQVLTVTAPSTDGEDARSLLIMGTLRDQSIWTFEIDGDSLTNAIRVPIGQRLRDLVQTPDGRVLMSTDSGQILETSAEALNFGPLID